MGSALLLALISIARGADCDLAAVVDSAESAGPRADVARIEPLRAELASAARCAPPPTPNVLARFWLAQGALLFVADRREEALDALATASRLNPMLSDAGYGPDFDALWREAAASPSRPGTLEITGAAPPKLVFIDGERWSKTPVSDGWHLVQVVEAGRPAAEWAQVHYVAPGAKLAIEVTGLAAVAPPPEAPTTPVADTRRSRAPIWLVGGGIAAELIATGLAGYALSLAGDIESASDVKTLDATFNRQKTVGYTAYGLAGGGAAAIGVGVALALGERDR